MEWFAGVLALPPLGLTPPGLGCPPLRDPALARESTGARGHAQIRERRRWRSVALCRHGPWMGTLRWRCIDDDEPCLLAEGTPEAEAKVHRDPDHQRHIGCFERLRAHARKEQLVVCRHAPKR